MALLALHLARAARSQPRHWTAKAEPRGMRAPQPVHRTVKTPSDEGSSGVGGGGGGGGGGMPRFTVVRGAAAPLNIPNVDTDLIIPKEFLKTIKRTGLGFAAFAEMRYHNPVEVATMGPEIARPNEDFVLNQPQYQDACILVAGPNFGCGSSREHAPWSISGMGIRCLIAPSFADIFYNNCFKNGMLPIVLPPPQVAELMADAEAGLPLEVDLQAQKVVRHDGSAIDFEVDPFRKDCLLNGLDHIGLTLQKMDTIRDFEAKRSAAAPWLDGATTRVPKIWPVAGMPRYELATPSQDDWAEEGKRLRSAAAA
mmetsp:Transcript_39097/g.127124  ORF Transcript_39097/g.127124 Transcript_39097/m.127124 type:complete len:311 (-) Transcript_39097:264-1196(-)